jgi:hypothetical protein
MSLDATSWVMANPSFMEPELLLQYNQKSDFVKLLSGGAPRVKLGSEDKYVYLRQLAVRTKVSSGQAGSNQLPSCSITTGLASAPTYLQQVRAEYDHHQTAMMAQWGTSIVEAQRLAMRQGHYQLLRNKALYGEFPSNGEGLLNSTGATTISLPADPYGNTTISTYDNGAMALFLLQIIQQLLARTYQLGQPQEIVVLGPQQDIGLWQYQAIVQLTAFQRAGAGSATTSGTVQDILETNGVTIKWGYDDTLIGAGSGGTDALLFIIPELKKPEGEGWNTNEFARLGPGFNANTLMYSDVVAPIEIPTPLPGGAIDILSEMRATSGWAVRPEAVTILSAGH